MIILKNDLESLISKYGIKSVPFSEATVKTEIVIDADNLDHFLELAVSMDCRHIFYSFKFYFKDDYLIPNDYYSDYPADFKELVKKNNSTVRLLDFNRAYSLGLYCVYNGVLFSFFIEDLWLGNLGYENMDAQMDKLESSFFAVSQEIKNREKEFKKNQLIELRDLIVNDELFRLKKNKAAREAYLSELLENEKYSKYSLLFNNRVDKEIFLDETWYILKSNK